MPPPEQMRAATPGRPTQPSTKEYRPFFALPGTRWIFILLVSFRAVHRKRYSVVTPLWATGYGSGGG
jgi:hypothetical protein